MRDAEEDEETRILDASVGVRAKSRPSRPSVLKRAPGLPPPLVQKEPPLPDADDDAPTRLVGNGDRRVERKWSISDGPSAPRDLPHDELLEELKAGTVSNTAFAWCKGMKDWQRVTDIPSLAVAMPSTRSSNPAPRPPPSLIPASAKLGFSKPEFPTAPSNQGPPKPPPPVHSSEVAPAPDSKPPSVLLSRSTSTAHGSEKPPTNETSSNSSSSAKPSRNESSGNEPRAGKSPSSQLRKSDAKGDPEQPAPRPAAGRKPTSDERVAKALPPASAPTASVLVTGMSQAMLDPKITTHREATQPARSRLTAEQLRAQQRQPNVLLWVLGAGGWVVAGVLAGVLVARPSTPASDTRAATESVVPIAKAAATSPLAVESPVAPEPPPAAIEGPPAAPTPRTPEAQADSELGTARLATPVAKPKVTTSAARPVSTAPVTSVAETESAPALDPMAGPAPAQNDVINSPGF